MKQRGMLFIVIVVGIVLVVALWFTIGRQETYPPAPTTNDGQKWRIGRTG